MPPTRRPEGPARRGAPVALRARILGVRLILLVGLVSLAGTLPILLPACTAPAFAGSPEGAPVTLPTAQGDWAWGPVGLAAADDGFVAVALGYGCGVTQPHEFATFHWSVGADGEPSPPKCRLEEARYHPFYNQFWGGSITRTPRGYAWTWLGLGGYMYVQALDPAGEPLAPLTALESGSVSIWGWIGQYPPAVSATSRGLVHVGCKHLASQSWVAKRRLEFDGTRRSLEGALNLASEAWSPASYQVAVAWNGERAAAAWVDGDDPESNGRRLMIRFLDADSRPLGPASVVARYPRGHGLRTLSIAPTATGWAVTSDQHPVDDEADVWLLLLDPSGALVSSRRVTPPDGRNAGGVTEHGSKISVSPSGNLGVLYPTWRHDGGEDGLWFVELDAAGEVRRAETRVPVESYEIGEKWDLAWSAGRWGVLWQDSHQSRTRFTWFAEGGTP